MPVAFGCYGSVMFEVTNTEMQLMTSAELAVQQHL